MGTSAVTMRCPACGQALRAVVAPAPPTQWFPCPSCHVPVPVVVPRDLPPLFSWEVLPGLYPHVALPRRPRWRSNRVASVVLAAAAVLAAVAAGVLGAAGFAAAEPAQYVVSGTVYEQAGGGPGTPVQGATVVLSVDGQVVNTTTTSRNGDFEFRNVPAGGIELNVTAPGPGYGGYSPTVVYTFASRSYSTQTRGLAIDLEPGAADNSTVNALTPFGDLETLLAYVGGAAVLFGGAAVAAGAAAIVVRRPYGAAVGVIGSGAAVAVPVVLLFLSLGDVFPYVTALVGVVGGAGAFALVLTTADVASSRPAPEPG